MTNSDNDLTGRDRATSADASFSKGDVVGERYHILRLVGIGGTGEVYEATDQALGGTVALKTLKPSVSKQPVLLERFRREIQNARRVTHANVCRIFDMGVHRATGRQRFFLTMEMLAGETLASTLEKGAPLETREAFDVLAQTAAGLQAAHDSNVIHRDLKPGNIILVPRPGATPRVVITDFGLAISADQVDSGLTESSELIGTPDYMAPEQTELGSATPATDVYALGIIAYELLSKKLPFQSEEAPIATVLKRRHEPPRRLREDLPTADPVWESAILRCLDREPARRFQRPTEFIDALQGKTPPASPAQGGGWLRRTASKLGGR